MSPLNDIDRAILNRIQSDFPITPRPYHAIAESLGVSEKDILKRLTRLKQNGIIRRIGGNFVPEKLGFVSTLCAAKVPEDKIVDALIELIDEVEPDPDRDAHVSEAMTWTPDWEDGA